MLSALNQYLNSSDFSWLSRSGKKASPGKAGSHNIHINALCSVSLVNSW